MIETLQEFESSVYMKDSTKTELIRFLRRLKTPASKRSYILEINAFCNYIQKDATKAIAEDCRRYLLHLENEYRNGVYRLATIVKKRRQLSSFFNFLCEQTTRELLSLPVSFENFFEPLVIVEPKEGIRVSKVPSLEEIDTIYSYLYHNDLQVCIAMLLSFKGFLSMRELLPLTRDCFLLTENGRMVVRVQNPSIPQDIRYNSIPKDMEDVLLSYFSSLEKKFGIDADFHLFANKDGVVISERTLRRRLANACADTGVKNFNFNDFRNAAAVYAVSYHTDVSLVSNSLGWKTQKHLNRLTSLNVTVNDAGDYMGINFKATPQEDVQKNNKG